MTDIQLKDRLAYILFGAKFVVIAWIFFQWMTHGFDFQQMIEVLTIVIPLFSVHLTMIIQNYLETKESESLEGRPLRRPLVVFSQLLPVAYTIYMLGVILALTGVSGKVDRFAEMKTLLGVGESIFGVYLGMVISSLFRAGHQLAGKET